MTEQLLGTSAAPTRLRADPAIPVIVVTDPVGDQRSLNNSDFPPPPPPVYSPSQRVIPFPRSSQDHIAEASRILGGLRARANNPYLSDQTEEPARLPPPRPQFLEVPQPAYPRQQNTQARMYFRHTISPGPQSLPEVTTEFRNQPARNAMCDVCGGRNTTGMSSCTVCTWHCCHECTIRNGLRRYHIAGGEVHIAPTTMEELQRTSFGPIAKAKQRKLEAKARRRQPIRGSRESTATIEASSSNEAAAIGAGQYLGAGAGNDSNEETDGEHAADELPENTDSGESDETIALIPAEQGEDVSAERPHIHGRSLEQHTSTTPARPFRSNLTSIVARRGTVRTFNSRGAVYTETELPPTSSLLEPTSTTATHAFRSNATPTTPRPSTTRTFTRGSGHTETEQNPARQLPTSSPGPNSTTTTAVAPPPVRSETTIDAARRDFVRTFHGAPIYTEEEFANAAQLMTFAGAAAAMHNDLQAGRTPDNEHIWETARAEAAAEIDKYKTEHGLDVPGGLMALGEHEHEHHRHHHHQRPSNHRTGHAVHAETEETTAPLFRTSGNNHLV
ncbi:uncharacterized protein BP01DRAFT_382918 [Aspergillus saccharolyticus JOP 1030-1]|uniref:Uncharacterized protein n=1 Tax=Aspergillus saccharolyticus JOP 1030-1 TaxID=1450539 RepID=A0A318ZCL9_9EURO|nr:hypothetical protein BP01DRAFT_382918 [Aspergillus saccharolyticus JOP 1030-1]PYH45085.1 hypothetical protein BP01DRAFT_382918 [Aspergillus saccharolyticus JOP 1030-1]